MFCKDYRDNNPNYIFELLDEEYIKQYNLTKDNFKKMLDNFDSDEIHIDNVYKLQQKGELSLYIVEATQLYRYSDNMKKFSIILKLDSGNNTFSVFLDNYINDKNYNNLKIGDKVKVALKKVEVNPSNKYDPSEKKITENVEDIFEEYTKNCIFYEKKAYNLLDNECKNNEFQSYELFDKYITDNIVDIVTMNLLSYEDFQEEGYVKYKCTSSKGLVYIFKVTSYITYTVTIE